MNSKQAQAQQLKDAFNSCMKRCFGEGCAEICKSTASNVARKAAPVAVVIGAQVVGTLIANKIQKEMDNNKLEDRIQHISEYKTKTTYSKQYPKTQMHIEDHTNTTQNSKIENVLKSSDSDENVKQIVKDDPLFQSENEYLCVYQDSKNDHIHLSTQ